MKRAILWIIALLMLTYFCLPVLAENSAPTYEIGKGNTEFLVIVTEAANTDMHINVYVRTNKSKLMDALTELDFIEVEKASWGYYVTSVLEIEPEGSGYWSILESKNGSFRDLSTPVQSTPLKDEDVFLFVLY